jgi:hypothetical protein
MKCPSNTVHTISNVDWAFHMAKLKAAKGGAQKKYTYE